MYTPKNQEAPSIDDSLLKDIPEGLTILKTPIWEPYNLYKQFIGQNKNEKINAGFLTEKKKPGLAEKISVWIRGNWFIPDARKFWIKPSVIFLTEYLKSNPVDVIISSGPPHSMHLIALGLKEKLQLPWLADFRDPWTGIDYYHKLLLSNASDRKHRILEKLVLEKADIVLTIGWTMAEYFRKIVNRRYEVIPNGFDESDFGTTKVNSNKKFTISHIGSMNADRNPYKLWEGLNELLREHKDLQQDLSIHLIGKTDYSVVEKLTKLQLLHYTEITEYLPHDQIIEVMQSASVLLLALNNTANAEGIISGKLFEYLASKRPILAIGPEDGDAARIIKETNTGVICDFNNKEKMKVELLKLYMLHKENQLIYDSKNTERYTRKYQTEQLVGILNVMMPDK